MSAAESLLDPVRSPGQVRQQLKQVIFRHLQKELKSNFRRSPKGCHYNRVVVVGDAGLVGVCHVMLDEPRFVLCDERANGMDRARVCPWWEPLRTASEVKSEFRSVIDSGDRGKIAARYPDVAALMWVLGIADVSEEIRVAESELDAIGDAPQEDSA